MSAQRLSVPTLAEDRDSARNDKPLAELRADDPIRRELVDMAIDSAIDDNLEVLLALAK